MCGISTGGWAYHLFLLEDREAEGFSSISWVWYQSEGRCWSEIFGLRHISEVFVVFKNRVNILVLAQIEALRCLFFEKGFLRSAPFTKWHSCRGGLGFFHETTWRGRKL